MGVILLPYKNNDFFRYGHHPLLSPGYPSEAIRPEGDARSASRACFDIRLELLYL
jgi:hypothetical protein